MTQPDGQRGTAARVATGPSALDIVWGSATHPGKRRTTNEDSVLASPPVFVVADGMGGHSNGDVASALAVDALRGLTAQRAVAASNVLDVIRRANGAILARSGDGARVMGTTVSGIVTGRSAGGDEILVLNVGDSRTYRLRDGRLEQLTTDHSHVQELIDAGLLEPSHAAHHPERNVVTRALGVDADVEVDLRSLAVAPGDRFLVCSDGLTGEVDHAGIAAVLAVGTPQDAADALVRVVLAGRAADNVSVVVVDITGVEALDCDEDVTDPRPRRRVAQADSALPPPVEPAVVIDGVPAGAPAAVVAEPRWRAPDELIDDVPAGGPAPEHEERTSDG